MVQHVAAELTGCNIIEGYGMTECSPLIAACPINVVETIGTIGVPVPTRYIKSQKDDGSEAKIGANSDHAKGDQVMR